MKNKFYFLAIIIITLIFACTWQAKAETFCGTSTKEQCTASGDCIVSGCFQSICKLKSQNITAIPSLSDCLWNICYDHKALNYECGCFSGQCQWNAIPVQVVLPPATSTPIIATTTYNIAPTSSVQVATTTVIAATTTVSTTTITTGFLRTEINRLTALIQTLTVQLLAMQHGLTVNMGFGGRGYQVKTLQTWLAKDKTIYPEGLVTGYFGKLTLLAVKRFQTKYASEVLTPRGLTSPDGMVENYARAKLNILFAK